MGGGSRERGGEGRRMKSERSERRLGLEASCFWVDTIGFMDCLSGV